MTNQSKPLTHPNHVEGVSLDPVEIWTRAVQAYQEGRTYVFSPEELKIVNSPDGMGVIDESRAARLREHWRRVEADIVQGRKLEEIGLWTLH